MHNTYPIPGDAMGNIKVLDDELISKIAAGEVIERPASVIKELIENSIDAGAKNITIELKEGGKSFIKVQDDGTGMDEEDATVAFDRHSTSKITSEKDLFDINSLGFRGEALASIASVAEVVMKTKIAKSIIGTRVEINGNEVLVSEIGCPKGTLIRVKNLFYNTPARKKYLKTIDAELTIVLDIVTRFALGYPNIFFKLIHNGREILACPATTNTRNNIANIYGRHAAKELLQVNFASANIEIMGFISKPTTTKPNKSYQSIFVNNRYISNKTISDAIHDAYHSLLMKNRHPIAILHVNIEPDKIDVNVHPTKREIRLSKEQEVYDAVFNAIRKTLRDENLIPEVKVKDSQQEVLITKKEIGKKDGEEETQKYKPKEQGQTLLKDEKSKKVITKNLPDMRIVGQVQDSFIVADSEQGMYLIDQHAAEERVNYEKFMAQLKDKNVGVQQLLNAIVVELSPKESKIVEKNLELLNKLGFKTQEFGKNSFVVRTFPTILAKQQDKELFMDIVAELDRYKNKIDDEKERLIIMKACKASVKANDVLTMPQMTKLIEALSVCEFPYSCPHGRPTIINFTRSDLEKKFKRK